MINIDILTTTRAEYGLMRPLIKNMLNDKDINMRLLVTGTHLSEKYGMTYHEIESDGIPIHKKIDILSNSDGVLSVSETMANALSKFTKYFMLEKPDFLLVDGDRYETMAVCVAAFNANVPIIHCGGGATTEGAADEFYRHSITKMAYLHFPTTETYRKRIIQLGENPERVFTVGSMGIENILSTKLLSKKELEDSLGFVLDKPFALVTFHPVTLENQTSAEQLQELLAACDAIEDMKFVFTMANADAGGREINSALLEYASKRTDKVLCVNSLGSLRYLSAMNYCDFVLGNSSSGLIETPSFKIPTVNIGDRQRGRIKAKSVIDCEPRMADIVESIKIARSDVFREMCRQVVNPNGDGKTTGKIISAIKEYCNKHRVDLKKKFYDVNFSFGD